VIAHGDQAVSQVGRLGKRNVDLPEDRQPSCALHPGRLHQLLRHLLEGLPQQKNAEGGGHIGQADPQDRVHQSQLANGFVVLHDQNVRHDHDLHEHQQKDDLLPGKFKTGERIRSHGAEDELSRQRDADQHEGVEEVTGEGRNLPGAAEVVQRQRRRQNEAADEVHGMEGRPDGIEQRRRPQKGQQPGRQNLHLLHPVRTAVDHW